MSQPERSGTLHLIDRARLTLQALFRDGWNRVRFGVSDPLYLAAVEVRPVDVQWVLTDEAFDRPYVNRRDAGSVRAGRWHSYRQHIDTWPKLRRLRQRFSDGCSWEATGAYDVMLRQIERYGAHDGCRNADDVVRRFADLDRLFERVQRERTLQRSRDLQPGVYRALGDPVIHLGPGGEPLFRGPGAHRLCIALILDLDVLPAQLGIVHVEALDTVQEMVRRRGAPTQ